MTSDANPRRRGQGLVLVLVLALVAAGPVARGGDPVRVKKDMAKVRADLEQRRKARGATAALPQPQGGAERAGRVAWYRFAPGQTIAYRVEIETERSTRTERFAGSPVFTVHSVEKDGKADLFAVGKLAYGTRPRGSDEWTERARGAVWIGSVVKVSPRGEAWGMNDLNDETLPLYLTALVKPKELIFTEVAVPVGASRSESSNAKLFSHSRSTGLGDTGFKVVDGRETRTLQASAASGSVVVVRKERTFQSQELPPLRLRYEATSRFDRDRGLLLDTHATYTYDPGPGPGSKPVATSIVVRLLEGEEQRLAVDQSHADWEGRPPALEPYALRRVRLDLARPTRLTSPKDARPGMTVVHNNDDGRWYLAEVVEVVDEKRYQVKVRYQGSGEVVVAHALQLAVAPADRVSSR